MDKAFLLMRRFCSSNVKAIFLERKWHEPAPLALHLQEKCSGAQPLLTIAIPTFNRSHYLRELLDALEPQLAQHADVEVLVSDNASADDTPTVTAEFQQRLGARLRVHRQPQNIGSDANFVFCFEAARGRYMWLCGDDDVLVPTEGDRPGALDQLMPHLRREPFDLVYATSYPFRDDWRAARMDDPLRRQFHVIASAAEFTRVVNIMFTFISGMVVNKERLLELQREDASIEPARNFIGSNLPQLSWTLPLLRQHRQSLVLWQRPVAGRQGNTGGYALGHVFGRQLQQVVARCLPNRPRLARMLFHSTLRRWLPSVLFDLRMTGADLLQGSTTLLRASYGSDVRFWLFAWPVLRLPLSLAKVALRLGAMVSKLLYIVEVPAFWRRQRRGSAALSALPPS